MNPSQHAIAVFQKQRFPALGFEMGWLNRERSFDVASSGEVVPATSGQYSQVAVCLAGLFRGLRKCDSHPAVAHSVMGMAKGSQLGR